MRIIVLLLVGIMSFGDVVGQDKLELEWSYFHPIKKSWNDLGKKGSVQEALIETGEMPDPFYGTNENQFSWFEEHVWEFKSLFFVSKEMLDKEYLELELPSVDTYAKFYLNDSLILETDNAFISHRVFIQGIVEQGLNEIHVFITPPVIYHEETYEEMGYELPAPNDVHDNAVAPLTRKPQYQFGWDWSLRLNTIGFHKTSSIYAYDRNRILSTSVNTISIDEKNSAELLFEVHFAVPSNDTILWESNWRGESVLIQLDNGVGRRRLNMNDANLWWPVGHGSPNMYRDLWSFTNKGSLIDKKIVKFGVRTSELIREKDKWGTSYYFKINGRKVFCKGGDYIPQDIFPSKVTDDKVITMVSQMAEANFNMVRVWGGGYYPDDVFYETCDD
ncbi:MAG: hypothetical protein MK066_11120, partial [Crocinitomicaceae bacterium]|nr:hypothetical protein [Crocinitomicaceae bacterium]